MIVIASIQKIVVNTVVEKTQSWIAEVEKVQPWIAEVEKVQPWIAEVEKAQYRLKREKIRLKIFLHNGV